MAPPIDMNRFEHLRASGELPSPRGAALAIIRLTQQEEVSIAELARVIAGDPAFVGRVIKAANGLIAFNRRPVVSVHEALMVLGLPAVRSMALGFSLLSDYRRGACRGFDYDAYWAFSLALALGMQAFAQRTRVAAADELFSLGLLMRVGELALATLYPDDYAEVLAKSRQGRDPTLIELERAAFAMTHIELGSAMLSDWGLPKVFVELAGYYDKPAAAGYADGSRSQLLLGSLAGARQFAEICVARQGVRPLLLHALLAEGERLGLNRDDVHADCKRMHRLWGEWGALLQLTMDATASFPEQPDEGADPDDRGEAIAAELRSAFAAERSAASSLHPEQGGEAAVEAFAIRALVVDSDATTRDAIVAFLHGLGHEVFEADCCSRVFERALDLQPQLMVIGCAMSDGGGLHLVRALRRMRIGQPIYMLLITNGEGEERLVEAFEAGVNDLVARSVGLRVLAARLHAGLREVKLHGELERDREELKRFAAELARSNRQLHEAALTDMLTGFRNRRYAIDRIEQEWVAADRSGRPLSCMLIDLDGLKEINDTFGHDAGDTVLRSTAEALRAELRGQDVICRIGGDEFLAICPGSDLEAASACAERLRQAVTRITLSFSGRAALLSVSIGVAEKTKSTADPDAMMKLADQGAYVAKVGGRNAVAVPQRDAGTGSGASHKV